DRADRGVVVAVSSRGARLALAGRSAFGDALPDFGARLARRRGRRRVDLALGADSAGVSRYPRGMDPRSAAVAEPHGWHPGADAGADRRGHAGAAALATSDAGVAAFLLRRTPGGSVAVRRSARAGRADSGVERPRP